MSRSFPPAVDVAIVGSGPNGAAYARVLSEQRTRRDHRRVRGRPGADRPAGHAREEHRRPRRAAGRPAALRGPAAAQRATTEGAAYTDPTKRGGPRRARTCSPTVPAAGGGRHPGAGDVQQRRRDGRALDLRLPAAGRTPSDRLPARPRRAAGRRGAAARRPRDPFASAPFSDVVRERLGAEFDPGRPAERRVRSMPLAVHVRDDGALVLERRRRRLRRGDPGQPGGHAVPRGAGAPGAGGGRPRRRRRWSATAATASDHEVRARYVVVAADALRTPQLLFASGVRPPALGRYLNDQPQMVFAVRLRDVARPPEAEHDPRGGHRDRASRAASPGCPTPTRTPSTGRSCSSTPPRSRSSATTCQRPARSWGSAGSARKDLQATDRVEFDEEATDDYGMPRPRIHYRLTERDRGRRPRPATASGAPARPSATPSGTSRSCCPRCLAALPGHHPDGRRRRRRRRSAGRTARSGASPGCTWPATTSSPRRWPATPRSPRSRWRSAGPGTSRPGWRRTARLRCPRGAVGHAVPA